MRSAAAITPRPDPLPFPLRNAFMRGDRDALLTEWADDPHVPDLLRVLDVMQGSDRPLSEVETAMVASLFGDDPLLAGVWTGTRRYDRPSRGLFMAGSRLAEAGLSEPQIRCALRELCRRHGWSEAGVPGLVARVLAASVKPEAAP